MLISSKSFFTKLINWEQKGSFKKACNTQLSSVSIAQHMTYLRARVKFGLFSSREI